jgi:hypothetical protein
MQGMSGEGNTSSTPVSCNCELAEGEKVHVSNYWGSRHTKEGM